MKPPRRIFRSSIAARSGRAGRMLASRFGAWRLGALWLGAAGLMAALVMVGMSSDLFGRGQPGPERVHADADQVAVIDGETLRVAGSVVRLAGIAAPERGDTCRGGKDCGGAATTVLAGLVRNRQVDCRLSGHDRLGRPFGACNANGTDLSRAIVAAGWARAQPETPGLADLELRARREGAGLWAASAVP